MSYLDIEDIAANNTLSIKIRSVRQSLSRIGTELHEIRNYA